MNITDYSEMFREAEADPEYWLSLPQTEFLEDVVRRMEEQGVQRACLAERLNTSRAWVTKLLRGDANFTLRTMVKVALALNGALHMHIADRGSIVRWTESPGTSMVAIAPMPGRQIGHTVPGRNEHANDRIVTADKLATG